MTKVAIVGAGPAGLLAAHYLLRRPNNEVEIYEKKRSDFQSSDFQSDRSFPIALQSRGLNAIRAIPGLEDALERPNGLSRSVWIKGSSIHSANSNFKITISPSLVLERNHIVAVFLQELHKVIPADNSSLKVHFDAAAKDIDVSKKTIQLQKNGSSDNEITVSYDVLIASDGARSKLRQLLSEKGLIQFSQTMTKEEYKSFYISCMSEDGKIRLDDNSIHGWMFGKQRAIAAPTREKKFAGVFIFPQGENPFSTLPNSEAVLEYIKSLSQTSLAPLITREEAENLRIRPVSSTWEVTCDKLTIGTDIIFLGDACHAVSGSLAQGCNSALQDVQELMRLLDQYRGDWAKTLPVYNKERLPEAHAVWELSSYNKPKSRFMRFEHILRMILSSLLPKWLSSLLLRPMPFQLLTETDLSYSSILEKTRWWIDRVKNSG